MPDIVTNSNIPLKVQFTNGKDFNLTGSEYIGYFNLKDGIPYASKYNQLLPLQVSGSTNSQIILSERFFDRTPSSVLTLPYGEDEILYQPNEIINKNSINFKIELLFKNFLEIINFSKLNNPDLPGNFTNFINVTGQSIGGNDVFGTNIQRGDVTVLSADLSTFTFGKINEIFDQGDIKINSLRGKFNDRYTLFLSVKNALFSYEIDNEGTTFTFINSTISFGIQNELYLNDIVDVADNNLNTLYIADSGNKSIYNVEVSDIVNLDRTGLRDFKLISNIGGEGMGNNNFDEIVTIAYGNNNVFVYDKGNKDIKNFDSNLTFIKKYNNNKFFDEYTVLGLSVDNFFNNLYVITKEGRILVLNIDNFNKEDEFNLKDINLRPSETPFKILFSQNNNNIYYILTNIGFYKFVKNTNRNIGVYTFIGNFEGNETWDTSFVNWENAQGSSFYVWDGLAESGNFLTYTGGDLLGEVNDYDTISLISQKNIFTLYENSEFIDFLDREDLNFYSKDEILLKDEYFNNITLNTSFYKLLFNLKLISISTNKQLNTTFDKGIERIQRIANIDSSLKRDTEIDDNFILNVNVGNNEPIAANIFNRQLSNILDYQRKLLKLFGKRINNTRIPFLSTITF